MYKAIIFDLGNVLIKISSPRIYEYWGQMTDLDPTDLAKRFPTDHIFDSFERGDIEPAVFRKYVMDKMGFHITDTEFDNGWNQILSDTMPNMNEILVGLRKQYRLAGLSNTNKIHADCWKVKYASLLANLETVFSSHEIGVRKPEPKAYEIVLKHLGLSPGEVIFVDDLPANVTGAVNLGLTGIVMSSPEQLVTELSALGIKIN